MSIEAPNKTINESCLGPLFLHLILKFGYAFNFDRIATTLLNRKNIMTFQITPKIKGLSNERLMLDGMIEFKME